jgi:hypothetical protein
VLPGVALNPCTAPLEDYCDKFYCHLQVFRGARVTRIERSSTGAQYYVTAQGRGENGADTVGGGTW